MSRTIIIGLTIMALFALWIDRPTPVKAVQVDYCPITFRAAAKDEHGQWHFGFAKSFGPCILLDRYENA